VHQDYGAVINALLNEQILTLLERVNIEFAAPEFLTFGADKRPLTPIEQIFQGALIAHRIPHQAQVKLGRFTVDFLVESENGAKVIVECDGKGYHHPPKDQVRDKILSSQGHPILRFTGSDIFHDIEGCIVHLKKSLGRKRAPAYTLDSELDESQQRAVRCVNGPIRVLAPAGSGKTKTLINRVLHLLNQGIPAAKILALAFNKKARDEMQERLERKNVSAIEVRTFHSLGYEIVREGLGWAFNESHRQTTRDLMSAAVRQHADLPARRNADPLDAFLDALSRAKMELPPLATMTVEFGEQLYPFEPIFNTYLQKQTAANHFDFDDMIYLAIRVLLKNTALRRAWQSKFEFVLVDEFQDLNQAQLLLLQILGLPENNIFAVGDDDQMIYGFRGAQVRHIVQFDKRFSISESHVLNTNYRSSRMVVSHTGWLIEHNKDRVPKDIRPRPGAQTGRFDVSGHASLLEQARFAAAWIAGHRKQTGADWRDYAVLYRYNAYQFPIAVMLDKLGIPHAAVSGQGLFKSAPGRDVCATLQVILSPLEACPADFERILKRPNKYLTNQLIAQARDWDSFIRLPESPGLREWEQKTLSDFVAKIEQIAGHVRAGNISAAECLQTVKIELGLTEFYSDQSRKSDDLDQAGDSLYFDVILSLAEDFPSADDFNRHIRAALDDNGQDSVGDADESQKTDKVFLSTIHKAKGKEFRNVVYFDLSQPDTRIVQEEEERRVVYVGATRPKDDLLITFMQSKPSQFLNEIALNPELSPLAFEKLERELAKSQRSLERETQRLTRLNARRDKNAVECERLIAEKPVKLPGWLEEMAWKIQDWRISQAQQSLDKIDLQIDTQRTKRIAPLREKIAAMEEEIRLRGVLGLKPEKEKA
jgi:DNA helicase II / ATP-dependent DNA helicase PcrA